MSMAEELGINELRSEYAEAMSDHIQQQDLTYELAMQENPRGLLDQFEVENAALERYKRAQAAFLSAIRAMKRLD